MIVLISLSLWETSPLSLCKGKGEFITKWILILIYRRPYSNRVLSDIEHSCTIWVLVFVLYSTFF